jgi:hypothetical protein
MWEDPAALGIGAHVHLEFYSIPAATILRAHVEAPASISVFKRPAQMCPLL